MRHGEIKNVDVGESLAASKPFCIFLGGILIVDWQKNKNKQGHHIYRMNTHLATSNIFFLNSNDQSGCSSRFQKVLSLRDLTANMSNVAVKSSKLKMLQMQYKKYYSAKFYTYFVKFKPVIKWLISISCMNVIKVNLI